MPTDDHEPTGSDETAAVADDERTIDDASTEEPRVPLDAPPETPVEDYLDQHRDVPVDDDEHD